MDLWNHLQNSPELADSLWAAPVVIIGLGLVAAFVVSDFDLSIAMIAGAALAAGFIYAGGTLDHQEQVREHIQEGVTEYVAAETDLTPLEPVTVDLRDNTASLRAADADGVLYDIDISWLPLDSADASGTLPDGVDPIEMVVTKRGGNDTTPDTDPSPASSATSTSTPEPATT